jgi:hypothetical protein
MQPKNQHATGLQLVPVTGPVPLGGENTRIRIREKSRVSVTDDERREPRKSKVSIPLLAGLMLRRNALNFNQPPSRIPEC